MAFENENELIYLYWLNDEEAFIRLKEYLKPITRGILFTFSEFSKMDANSRLDYELQADMVLAECLERYKPHVSSTFSSFYRTSLKNKLMDEIRRYVKKSENRYPCVPLDAMIDRSQGNTYVDHLSEASYSYEEDLYNKLEVQRILELLEKKLTKEEMDIVKELAYADNYNQIREKFGISRKKVVRVIEKAKKTLGLLEELEPEC